MATFLFSVQLKGKKKQQQTVKHCTLRCAFSVIEQNDDMYWKYKIKQCESFTMNYE